MDRLVSKAGFRMNHPRLVLHDFSIIVPVLGRDKVVFVWNYRPPIQGWELELPAGLLNDGNPHGERGLSNALGRKAGTLVHRVSSRPSRTNSASKDRVKGWS